MAYSLTEVADLRGRVLAGTATSEELRAMIEKLRMGRAAASGTAKTAKAKTSKSKVLTDADLDSLMEGL